MKLVYEATGHEVTIGDLVNMHNELSTVQVDSIEKPKHGGSTGRVYVNICGSVRGYYPGVIGAKWVEREDQE